jgi:hypothetical protein
VDQHVWHCGFVNDLTVLSRLFFGGAKICRQTSRLLDVVDIQLVKDVAILWQLREVVVVQGEIAVARVVVGEESKPDLNCCSADSEAVAELSVHLFNILGSTRPEDDNVQIIGQQGKLGVYLANVAEEVYNMSTVLVLLPTNLKFISYRSLSQGSIAYSKHVDADVHTRN